MALNLREVRIVSQSRTESIMEAAETAKLERHQFDMLTLLLLPLFIAFGYMLAYAVRIWSFWLAIQWFGYYPISILLRVPIGFSSALYDFPGIVCLYAIVFVLAACRGTVVSLAIGILLIDWTAVIFADAFTHSASRAQLLSHTWGSLVLIIAAVIPWFLGRRWRGWLSEPQQRRLQIAAISFFVIVGPLAFIGFHQSPLFPTVYVPYTP